MKKFQLLTIMSLICFGLVSCGSPRQVRYVYVNAPQQQAPPTQQAYNYPSNPNAQPPTTLSSNYQTQTSTSSKDCISLSTEHIEGVYRGFGHGRSSSLTAARNMAMQRAKTEILRKASGIIDALSNDDIDSDNAAACERFKDNSKQRIRGVLKNTRIVCSNIQEGGINEVRFCLEVSARDVATLLEPIIKELEAENQAKIREKLNQGQM